MRGRSMGNDDDVVDLFARFARMGETVQRQIVALDNRPAANKRLRRFGIREAARWLGMDELPAHFLANAPPGRRELTLADLHELRHSLGLVPRLAGPGPAVITVANFKGGAGKT